MATLYPCSIFTRHNVPRECFPAGVDLYTLRGMNIRPSVPLFLMALALLGCTQKPSSKAVAVETLYHGCQLCHSKQELQRGPVLDGQNGKYLARQLQKFKNGQRGKSDAHRSEALMGTATDVLAEKDIKRISRYIAAQPPKPYQPSVKGDMTKGEVIYTTTCMSCHGKQAEGSWLFKTGSLAIFEDWYLLAQLRHYKHGRRGAHPDDAEGQLMVARVADMDDTALIDVVTYIASAFGSLTNAPPGHASVQD